MTWTRRIAIPCIAAAAVVFWLSSPVRAFDPQDCVLPCSESPTLDDCQHPEYSSCKCPHACVQLCIGLSAEQVAEDPLLCGKCPVISRLAIVSATVGISPQVVAADANVALVCTSEAAKAALEAAKQSSESLCDKGPAGCCIETEKKGDASGKGEIRIEKCEDGDIYYADCYCKVGDTISPPKLGQSFSACEEHCKEQGGEVDLSQGIGVLRARSKEGAGKTVQQFVNALCFTQEECADEKYGGTVDAWVRSAECPAGKGKCRAPEPDVPLSSPVLGIKTVRGMRSFVDLMFRYMLTIVAIAAAVAFIWGGVKYLIGSSAGDVTSAKKSMTDAIVGLILSIASVALLNTINPALTSYDRLDVWLINRFEFSDLQYCRDYKGTAGKPVMFAEAGDPPGAKPYDTATFELPVEKTICGSDYYPKGFAGKTCRGLACDDKKKVCMACETGLKECLGKSGGMACVQTAFAGNIRFADGAQPTKVRLLGVCNYIQPASGQKFNSDKVSDNIPASIPAQISPGASVVTYLVQSKPDELAKLKAACADKGGLRGVVLGVTYKDTDANRIAGAAIGFAIGGVPGAVTGAVVGGPTIDDVLIVSKQNCSESVQYFSGYADGTASSADISDMRTGVYCGYRLAAPAKFAKPEGHETTFDENSDPNVNPYWSVAELESAFSGDGEAIQCNFFLNKNNAPADPGTTLMAGCREDWCFLSEGDCND